ncbi:MAG: hypothetical protein O7C75_03190, partial [Verrucomicrobia bacterium]|nr:hypothetical protein [Verrucomicrobiota bacterium]
QLPKVLRKDVKTVSIHKGVNPFGGGNNNLLIHSGQGDDYITSGILEETLVHEASHTSLDAEHANASDWLAAQAADDEFITTYARDNANREDIAESFLVYMAIRHRADRISESLLETIETTIPNRIAYFDNQDFDLFPIVIPEKAPEIIAFTYDTSTHELDLNWVSQLSSTYSVDSSVNLDDWKILSAGLPSQGITTQVKITVEDPPNHIFFRIREE